MNELKRGSLVMRCVADGDVEGYVKSGWKLVSKEKSETVSLFELKNTTNFTETQNLGKKKKNVDVIENDSNSDTIEE